MYNTPVIRTGGFGALQVEAITNRPQSIARRHLAASQLRMRDVEPDELSSSEWVQFLVMEDRERDRWISNFIFRRRRNSDESTSSSNSADTDAEASYSKAEEAREEGQQAQNEESRDTFPASSAVQSGSPSGVGSFGMGRTPPVSLWAREFDRPSSPPYTERRPRHRRAVTDSLIEAPPAYENVVRPRSPPPAYRPRGGADGGIASP